MEPSTEAVEQPDGTLAEPIEAAERVVALTSLSADLTNILDPTKLVGIPGSPLIAQDARFANIPTISAGRSEPDLEKIINLQPDLVIGAKGFHDKTLQRLNGLGISVLTADIHSWEALRSFTATLAGILDADAQPILARYDSCLTPPSPGNVSALVLVSRQPILAPNKNSWAGDFLEQLNVQNLAADLQGESPIDGYVTLSAENVIEANPDSIMVVDTGEDLLSQLQNEPFWSQLTATKEGTVLSFDYFGLVNPGSLDSIEATCTQLKQAIATE
ncbi:MAG: ABC transporter substrate-binding protein [Cyanobacteria bacterium J06634_6]